MIPFHRNAACAPLRKARVRQLVSLLLVAISTFTAGTGVLAAPAAVNPTRLLPQEESIPNAPFGRSLYLPAVSSDRKQLETLEVDVVRLDDIAAQTTSKAESASSVQDAAGALPAPPPGEEVYPAQPDDDGNGDATAATETPAALDASVTLLQEDFDGIFPTLNWRVLDQDGEKNGEYYWDDDTFKPLNGDSSAWVANGGKNGLDPEFYNYPNNLHTWMIAGPFDLSDASSANLTFNYWNLSEINYDYFGWYASPNGNDFYGMRVSGNSQGWKPVTLNLASVPVRGNLLGDSSVWIAFRFLSDGSTTNRGAFVDQVRVRKEINAGCAGEFKAEYFNNRDLSGTPVFTRCEKAPINHNWGTSSPGSGIGSDNFSVRWTGSFDFEKANYNFVTATDDGVRVWLDNNQILNNWQDQGLTPNLVTRQMSAGKHTLRVEYYEDVGGAAAQFRWLRSNTTVSNRQGFDTCFLPHPSEMANWWGNSPYYEIGIYIGGSNRGCRAHNEEHLNASWIATVQKQGWNFIPTWVGPQAPCTVHNFYTMSSDPQVAFAEGRHEAGNASAVAKSLGLTTQDVGGTVIYYDMEPYPNDANCRETVKSFMAGWASRLHELGNQAGAYGAACASYITDWVLNPPYTVDHIWPAAWIYPGYNPNATPYNVSCIDNSLWSNHQRIRQYAGDHNERWGVITLNIDSNILDGEVAGSIPRASAVDEAQAAWQPVEIAGMQLLAETSGWVIAQGQWLWTSDGGVSWTDRTPAEVEVDVRAASFLDGNTGWLVGAGVPDAQGRSTLYLGKSTDSGLTWRLRPLHEFDPIEPGSTQGTVKLNFFDANTGYMQIKLASSSNFELYTLLKSVDGGATWQEVTVPGSSPVRFADASNGWTVATTSDAPVQVTTDGGVTWSPSDALPLATSAGIEPLAAAASNLGATATTSLTNGTGWAYVEQGLCSGTKPVEGEAATAEAEPFDCIQYSALLSTTDGGSTWVKITPVVE
jgi:hypothetical protein